MCEHARRKAATSNLPKSKLGLITLTPMGDLHELPQQIFRARAGDLETPCESSRSVILDRASLPERPCRQSWSTAVSIGSVEF
jgi:hypothetical protein